MSPRSTRFALRLRSGRAFKPRCEAAALLLCLGILLHTGFAQADLSFWDGVKNPKLREQEALLRSAERSRVSESELLVDGALDRLLARRTAILIELGGGGEGGPLGLRFLYGESLVRAELGQETQGRALLLSALGQAPGTPLTARVWAAVGSASAASGDFEGGEAAYSQALHSEWNPARRTALFQRRAEARMRMQKLADAISDYQRSLLLARDATAVAIAHWGLGVAYDRDDNFPLARREIERALAINIGTPAEPRWAIDSPDVAFFPSHEEHYYRALGLMVQALTDIEPKASARGFKRSMSHWDGYLLAAQADGDPWLRQARRNRSRCSKELSP